MNVSHLNRISFLVTRTSLLLLMLSVLAPAQTIPCDHGIIQLPLNVNGKIEICPALAAQAPALQSQLSEITKSLGAQQEELKEIRRLIKGLNSVSGNIGNQRQGELLRNLSSQLAVSQQAGQKQTQQQISTLADGFDGVKDELVEMLTNQATAEKANAAVQGSVGDAIAKLDLTSARDQLEDIRKELKAIHADVGQVKQTTTETNERVKDIQQTITQAQASQQEQYQQAVAQMNKARAERESDPTRFLTVRIFVSPQLVRGARGAEPGKWQIQAIVTSPAHFTDSLLDANLEILFQASGKKPWRVSFPPRPVFAGSETLSQTVDDMGQQAVVCFTARDPKTQQRQRWRQSFTVEASSSTPVGRSGAYQMTMQNFVAAAQPTLNPATDQPCE